MTIAYPDDDLLGPIEVTPSAKAKPKVAAPAPASPSLPAVPAGCHTILAMAGVLIITVVITAGSVAWWLGPRDSRPASVDAVTLGRSFAPILAGTLADGFDADADALEAGKTVGEANTELKRVFDSGRKAAFEKHAGSMVTSLVPEGKTIDSPEIRRALVQAHRDFAKGLRGGK